MSIPRASIQMVADYKGNYVEYRDHERVVLDLKIKIAEQQKEIESLNAAIISFKELLKGDAE